jgi:RNA polymerase sigma factor (sigma-70 family)
MSADLQVPGDVTVAAVLEMVARQLHRFFRGGVELAELRSLGAAAATDARRRWDGRGSFEAFAAQRIEWGILRELKRQKRRDRRAALLDDACALAAAGDAAERHAGRDRAKRAAKGEAEEGGASGAESGGEDGGSFVKAFLDDMAAGFTVEVGAREAVDAVGVADPESNVERDVARMELRDAVCALPSGLRELVESYYYRGETLEEIGEQIGAEMSTVQKRLKRALSMLRDRLCREVEAEVVPLRRR